MARDSDRDRGTPSKGRRNKQSSKISANTIMLGAALLLGVFTVCIVGFSMHPMLMDDLRGQSGANLPGQDQLETAVPTLMPGCLDKSVDCPGWAEKGHCDSNPGYMYEMCLASCGGCGAKYLHNVEPLVHLPGGLKMPRVGFGSAGLGDQTTDAVDSALRLGYRRIDTAQAREWYREDLVGAALRSTSVPREDIFITTKVHPRDFGRTSTPAAIKRSLQDLGTTYLDLVLLHYPDCWGDICGGQTPEGTWRDSWAALEELVGQETIKCIGVSNFHIDQLQDLLQVSKIKPCLVQVGYEPLKPKRGVQAFCAKHKIHFETFSTLGGQYRIGGKYDAGNPVLTNSVVTGMASDMGKSPAQIVLRWALQRGMTVVPKSKNVDHMKENIRVFDFDLTNEDMDKIETLSDVDSGE